jgi:hypothetical protein
MKAGPKCGIDGKGKWVCTHTPVQHEDNSIRKRKPDTQDNASKAAKCASPPPTLPHGINVAALTQFLQQYQARGVAGYNEKSGQDTSDQDASLDPDDYQKKTQSKYHCM